MFRTKEKPNSWNLPIKTLKRTLSRKTIQVQPDTLSSLALIHPKTSFFPVTAYNKCNTPSLLQLPRMVFQGERALSRRYTPIHTPHEQASSGGSIIRRVRGGPCQQENRARALRGSPISFVVMPSAASEPTFRRERF